jgi:hypothetical protein
MRKYAGYLLLLAIPASADAHFYLTWPAPRYTDQLFTAPCGRDPELGRDHVTTLHSGSEIAVTWVETITNTPSYFRLSFDDDGQDDFPPTPTSYGAVETSPAILLNDIPHVGAPNAGMAIVKLPDIECDNCTLQMTQILGDHFPFGGTDDFHYECADVVLVDDTVFTGDFEAS